MKFVRTAFEAFLVLGTGLSALLAVVFGMPITQVRHTVENGRALDEAFRTSVSYIDQFSHKNGRLPSQVEFSAWKTEKLSHIQYGQSVELIAPGQLPEHAVRQLGLGSTGRYALSIWRGEWAEYYAPWVEASTVDSQLGLYASSIGLCLASAVMTTVLWHFVRKARTKNIKPLRRSPT